LRLLRGGSVVGVVVERGVGIAEEVGEPADAVPAIRKAQAVVGDVWLAITEVAVTEVAVTEVAVTRVAIVAGATIGVAGASGALGETLVRGVTAAAKMSRGCEAGSE
jgi:hypothetical protein